MKHDIKSINVSGDYVVVTVGDDVAYVALDDLPDNDTDQDALIEAKVDAMLADKPTTVPVKYARAAAVMARLKPAGIVREAVLEDVTEKDA